jgi:transposase-like protein
MPRHSVEATREAWRKRLERFARSGLPVARFCSAEGVSVASFYYWRRKLRQIGKLAPETARPQPAARRSSFQPVRVVPPASGVSIHLAGGVRIELRAGDLDALRAVVAELAGADRDLQPGAARC